jgi:hypothetical protein
MRKALIGLIMAATVMSPIAAQAQEWRGARADRGGRAPAEQRQAPAERSEARTQRQQARQQVRTEQRQARQQVRQERQQVRQGRQQAQQAQQAQPVAVAQRQRGDRRDGSSGRRGSAYPDAWQGNPNDPARQRYERLERQNQYRYGTREQRREIRQEQRGDRRDGNRDWRGDRRDGNRDWRGDRRDGNRDWRGDRRADRRDWRRDWNRSSWRSDRRYDWRDWRYRNRSHFRLSPYYAPYRNYRYSRFSIGLFLQPLFYNQRYWISDPWSYRLPYAPAGTQWVRYYNDVILVDVYSGEVVDVIYDFFW